MGDRVQKKNQTPHGTLRDVYWRWGGQKKHCLQRNPTENCTLSGVVGRGKKSK